MFIKQHHDTEGMRDRNSHLIVKCQMKNWVDDQLNCAVLLVYYDPNTNQTKIVLDRWNTEHQWSWKEVLCQIQRSIIESFNESRPLRSPENTINCPRLKLSKMTQKSEQRWHLEPLISFRNVMDKLLSNDV